MNETHDGNIRRGTDDKHDCLNTKDGKRPGYPDDFDGTETEREKGIWA
jgi:hypothetical protein